MAVFLSHIIQSQRYFLLPPANTLISRSTDMLGVHAVTVFFTLSGFLITYLLLTEKRYTNTINIFKFYTRRVLRIWPLYYLYLLLAVIFALYFGMQYQAADIFYYIFLAGNIPFILHDGFPFLAHYWSLGVEEQFYLFWPFIISFCNKNLLRIMLASVIVLICIKGIFWAFYYDPGVRSILSLIVRTLRFENMLLGAILAYIHIYCASAILLMIKKYIQVLSWILFVIICFEIIHFSYAVSETLLSCASCFLIASQLKIEKSIIKLEHPVFNFLGKVSYGIYVFHPLVIYLVSRLVKHYEFSLPAKYSIAYLGSGFFTILTAYSSYEFFEKKFLGLKQSFAVIKSY